ncbi:MAG: hypothetical protein U0V70_20745 [Terriglobia bacterium]
MASSVALHLSCYAGKRSLSFGQCSPCSCGVFQGHEANTFASVFDVIPVEARGTAVGVMNLAGWLVGGGTAPVVIGYIAQREGLGRAISWHRSAMLQPAYSSLSPLSGSWVVTLRGCKPSSKIRAVEYSWTHG